MNTFRILYARPALFFRLSGIRIEDFDKLVKATHPLWLESEHKRLSRPAQNGSRHDKRIFADTHRNNGRQNMIAKNVGALANINLKTA